MSKKCKRRGGKGMGVNEIEVNKMEVSERTIYEEKKGVDFMMNWYNAMLESNVAMLRSNVEQVVNIVTDGIIKDQYKNLHFLFHSASDKIEALGNLLDIDSNQEYCKVFAYAIFWVMDKISDKLYGHYLLENSIKNKCEEVKQLRKSKYFYPMLELLEKNGELPQGIIAKNLSVSTNALSNFLRRNEKYGLWGHMRYGKYNYYHLTSQGKSYLSLSQKQELRNNNDSINSILIHFMDYLADEIEEPIPNVENISHKINMKFGNGQAIFGSESDKLAMQKAIRRINIYARRKERQSSFESNVFYKSDEFFYAQLETTIFVFGIEENVNVYRYEYDRRLKWETIIKKKNHTRQRLELSKR